MDYQPLQLITFGVFFGVVITLASLQFLKKPIINRQIAETKKGRISLASRVLVATRIHQVNCSKPVDLMKVGLFLEQALGWDDSFDVAIAVGAEDSNGQTLVDNIHSVIASILAKPRWSGREIYVVAVSPWGKFVAGLNALIRKAVMEEYEYILFSSIETKISPIGIKALRSQMSDSDLVVGAAFADHEFKGTNQNGHHVLDGLTTPWNTLALWHVATLALVGFIGVAEGIEYEGIEGGVEEVTTIALIQHLLKVNKSVKAEETIQSRSGAKLVLVPGLTWSTKFEDNERRQWHERKMKSKVERAAKHMSLLPALPPGAVLHLSC